MSKKTKILDTKMLYYFMKGVTISIFNESFITFIQPAVMPSPPQTPALHIRKQLAIHQDKKVLLGSSQNIMESKKITGIAKVL